MQLPFHLDVQLVALIGNVMNIQAIHRDCLKVNLLLQGIIDLEFQNY